MTCSRTLLVSARCTAAVLVLATFGCNELPPDSVPRDPVTTDLRARALSYTPQDVCQLDSDCTADSHCFQGRCVTECAETRACADERTCTARGRCVPASDTPAGDSGSDAAAVDGAHDGEHYEGIRLLVPDDTMLRLDPTARDIEIVIETDQPLPNRTLYVTLEHEDGRRSQTVRRLTGTTQFVLLLDADTLLNDEGYASFRLITSVGTLSYEVARRPSIDGRYLAVFSPLALGGAYVPLTFTIQTTPPGVHALADADAVYLLVDTEPRSLVSLPEASRQAEAIRTALQYDAWSGDWVAVVRSTVDPEIFQTSAGVVAPTRELRFELRENHDGGTRLDGRLSDRWTDLYVGHTDGGIAVNGLSSFEGTLVSQRVAAVETPLVMDSVAAPALATPSPLQVGRQCTPASYATATREAPACDSVQNASLFDGATAGVKADCALEAADTMLQGDTLTQRIRDYLQDDGGGSEESFQDFLRRCAAGQDAACVVRPELQCARALLAGAYEAQEANAPALVSLMATYEDVNEAHFLGRQLAAFQVDNTSRLNWLRTSEAPLFLASALRQYNTGLLATWKAEVLDAHIASVFGLLDRPAQSFLFRASQNADVQEARQQLILQIMESWSAAAEGVVLLSERQSLLLQDTRQRERAAQSAFVVANRLYAALVLLQASASEVAMNTAIVSGGSALEQLIQSIALLETPFQGLLFRRDAEVQTVTSLDSQSTTRSLLRTREQEARKRIAQAAASVDRVLDDAQSREVRASQIGADYEQQILSLRNEIIELCGLPAGCALNDVGFTEACALTVESGRCGATSGADGVMSILPSEAGRALLEIEEATVVRAVAYERARQHGDRLERYRETTLAFERSVNAWHRQRQVLGREIEKLTQDIASIRNQNLADARSAFLATEKVRSQMEQDHANYMGRWGALRSDQLNTDIHMLDRLSSLEFGVKQLQSTSDLMDDLYKIALLGVPKYAGAAVDPSAEARRLTYIGGKAGELPLKKAIMSTAVALIPGGLYAANLYGGGARTSLEIKQKLTQIQLQTGEMQLDAYRLGQQNAVALMEETLELDRRLSENEQHRIQALIDAAARELEVFDAYENDLVELRDRADTVLSMLLDSADYTYAVMQAELLITQRVHYYEGVVQRAALLNVRFDDARQRQSHLRNLLGSPSVLFAYANDMRLAERRIDQARAALEDWLIALEYYAVRPFIDQRLAVLLARNPQQLEAIANDIGRLQAQCGGPATLARLDLSLRYDLLDLGRDIVVEGQTFGGLARFHAILDRASVPMQRSTLLSPTETLGARIDQGNVLAANFNVSVHAFANLQSSCNAKLQSIALQFVGLDGNDLKPVASIIYDGQSQLRSCQPDLNRIVTALGPDTTAFAAVTAFSTGARAVAPVGKVGSFGPATTWNATLEGSPLAAGYAILIDKDHPSNQDIDWDTLQDIRVQFEYSYQDPFPAGQCQ